MDISRLVKPRVESFPMRSNPHRKREVSLERALSKLGLATRQEARRKILAGEVRVDGAVVLDPKLGVVPETIEIAIDGTAQTRVPRVVVLLHKPRGVVTTRSDPQGRRTVYDCLVGLDEHVIPVGRLDAASSGLLVLTNDTRLADFLTDPLNAVPRTYLVTVRGRVGDDVVEAAMRGVEERGEQLAAAAVKVRKASGRESHLVVELRQGKNREIRRLFAALGHEVTALKRVAFGDYGLGDLAVGEWRRVPAPQAS